MLHGPHTHCETAEGLGAVRKECPIPQTFSPSLPDFLSAGILSFLCSRHWSEGLWGYSQPSRGLMELSSMSLRKRVRQGPGPQPEAWSLSVCLGVLPPRPPSPAPQHPSTVQALPGCRPGEIHALPSQLDCKRLQGSLYFCVHRPQRSARRFSLSRGSVSAC